MPEWLVRMNAIHWTAQLALSAVFLIDGISRILAFRRRAKIVPASPAWTSIRLPFELGAAIAVIEVAGALALWVPADLWPPDILPRLAAAGLALLAVAGSIHHVRRKETAAYSLAVFLLAVLVIMGR
jgi:hypothetical protein